MMNVAPVVFPALSLTTKRYMPVAVISVPLVYNHPVYAQPLSVAVTHSLLSKKSMITPV